MGARSGEITELLVRWRAGDDAALERLSNLVHSDLYRMARRQLKREREGHTMHPSSLVQEAYLRLLRADAPWQDRAHFLAVAVHVMRHVLVDYARRKRRLKRGGPVQHLSMDRALTVVSPEQLEELVAVNLALERLGAIDERKCRVFEMRFFGGLGVEETAEALGISPVTVTRDWNFARAWLRRELGRPEVQENEPVARD